VWGLVSSNGLLVDFPSHRDGYKYGASNIVTSTHTEGFKITITFVISLPSSPSVSAHRLLSSFWAFS
jgi:hypothetical protein